MFQRSQQSGNSWFSRLRNKRTGRKGSHQSSRYRRAVGEMLEPRTMLTSTLYVDFGAGFTSNGLRMTLDQMVNDIQGPDLIFPPAFLPEDVIKFESLRSYMGRLLFDFDGQGGRGDAADYTALRNSVMDIVRRQYEPFDIVVKEGRARTIEDVTAAFNMNNGDPTGQFDSYVFVSNMVNIRTGVSLGDIGFFGVASGVDLGFEQNLTDETVIVAADICLKADFKPADLVLAHVISHEAGHSFGLRHSEDGWDLGQQDLDIDLLSSSDIMREGGVTFPGLANIAFFTRYNYLQEGDKIGITTPFEFWDPFDRHNYYDQLVNDPDIGPADFAYVSGTGAYDDISITRIDDTSAFVSVSPHRSGVYNAGTLIPFAPFSYVIDYTNGILIDGGWNNDRITIDATLGVDIRVRGGEGRNELRVLSNGVTDAIFNAGGTPERIAGLPGSLGGSVLLSGLGFSPFAIDFIEFGTDSSVTFDGFVNLTYRPPATGRVELMVNGGAIDGRMRTAQGFVETTIMRFVNTANVIVDTSLVQPLDNIDTNDQLTVAGNSFSVPGLQNFEFKSGRGNDRMTIAVTNFELPIPGGKLVFDGGDGIDTIATEANANWILNDTSLVRTGAGIVHLVNLFGEKAELAGGGGANTFTVESWSGTGTLDGKTGNDVFNIGLSGRIDAFHGNIKVIGGGGNDMLNLDDSGSADDVNYSVGKTRVTNGAGTTTPFGRVSYESSLENLILTGTSGKNKFFVTPSQNLTIKIDGLDPPDGTPPLEGDHLSMDFGSAEGRRLINAGTGAGIWTFTSGESPVYFEGIELQGSLVAAAAQAGDGKPLVKVYNSLTNKLMFKFYAYEQSFKGGVNVVMSDVSGDGILDVVVAPGAGRRGEVKVYDSALMLALAALHPQKLVEAPETGKIGPSMLPEGTSYQSGLQLAAGDIDGDGDADVVTSRLTGLGKVRVFEKTNANNYINTVTFTPYSANEGVTRGAVIAAGDIDGDGRDEVITAPSAGAVARIKTWNAERRERSQKFFGFESTFKGGVSLSAGDADGDGRDEIFVAAGVGGGSRVRVFSQYGAKKNEFQAFTSGNTNAPVQIAARGSDPDNNVALYMAQGNDGQTKRIRILNPLTGATVDSFLETDPEFGGGIAMG